MVLVGCGDTDNALFKAVWRGNIGEVAGHLAAGADVNSIDEGWTLLYTATFWQHKEIVERLIAAGADVNASDHLGITPLDLAVRNDKTETADLLRKHGGKTGEELKAEGK